MLLFDGLLPKLADFGLAVIAGGSTLHTLRAAAGTITHTAPEQLDVVFSFASAVALLVSAHVYAHVCTQVSAC